MKKKSHHIIQVATPTLNALNPVSLQLNSLFLLLKKDPKLAYSVLK